MWPQVYIFKCSNFSLALFNHAQATVPPNPSLVGYGTVRGYGTVKMDGTGTIRLDGTIVEVPSRQVSFSVSVTN